MSLFKDLKLKAQEEGLANICLDLELKANHGWFERFKTHANLQCSRTSGKGASAGVAAAVKFCEELLMINKRRYSLRQIFSVDEMGLFWKRMPY
jgi:hypothetical protein